MMTIMVVGREEGCGNIYHVLSSVFLSRTFPVSSARVVAMALVPLAKASISNTPMGPFQITV